MKSRENGGRKRTGSKKFVGEKEGFGAKKRFTRGDGDERKSSPKDYSGERPYRKRPQSEDGERKRSYGDSGRKPYERKSFGKRPYPGSRGGDDRKRTFDRSDSAEDKRKWNRKEDHESNEGYERREDGDRKPYERKSYGKRPYSGDRNDDRKKSFRRSGSDNDGERKWNRKEDHEFYGERKQGRGYNRSFSQKLSGKKQGKSGSREKHEEKKDDGLTRLNKFIANAGVCSRREADQLIELGAVTVNGEIITTLGYKVKPDDVVKYNNETLKSENNVYLLLNKPKDFITTVEDPQDRKTVMWLVKDKCKERVYPVGRLDRNTTGVLLFTNDGDLARKLTHPSFEVEKIYQATLDKALKPSDLESIEKGVHLEDGFIKPDVVSYTGPDKSVIGMEIHSGRNHIVRRIFEHLGYEVVKLDRVVFAGLTKKDLARGRSRFLTQMEVANLKMLTGKKKFQNI